MEVYQPWMTSGAFVLSSLNSSLIFIADIYINLLIPLRFQVSGLSFKSISTCKSSLKSVLSYYLPVDAP